jgi:carbamoylphosphate synthase large subunit
MVNVAVFPAGTEIGLEINRALKYSTHIKLFGLSSIPDHSRCVYKNYSDEIPYYSDKSFIQKLNKFIEENRIDYIYPAHDDVQLFLTENANLIKAEIITSELDTVRLCRSKIKTYKYFSEFRFIPQFYNSNEIDKLGSIDFPIFIKPDIGQGSKGAIKLNSLEELKYAIQGNEKLVICEYLPGEEYTVDCFTDFKGKLRVCNIRNRIRIKSGISVNSKILKLDDEVSEIATIINDKLRLRGAWFFQLKKDKNGKYKLMEIAPRVSGTMGLSRNTGTNYPLLSIFDKMGTEIKIIKNSYDIEVDRALFSRFITNLNYDSIYIDLDDTLIIDNKVNNYLMMFVYQSLNQGKKIYLLTKHENDVYNTLEKYRISKNIFDKIFHLSKEEHKSNYIEDSNSIFIDDSFSERYDVSTKTKIAVFDSSEIESLIDWRL